MSQLTPLPRMVGPDSPQLIASSRFITPTPCVRRWKILLPVTRRLHSSRNFGKPLRNSSQSGTNVAGKSPRTPPTVEKRLGQSAPGADPAGGESPPRLAEREKKR